MLSRYDYQLHPWSGFAHQSALQLFYANESSYLAILALTKISILLFLLRIFPQRWFRNMCWAIMAWVASASFIFFFIQVFQCLPVDAIWEAWKGDYPRPYRCLDVNAVAYAAAGFSIAQDVVILLMPLPVLLELNTSWRIKLEFVVIFGLGVFVTITSCIRLHFIVQFARSLNPAWDYTDSLIWSSLEVAVSIIVTSLPAIRALLTLVWPKLFGATARKSSSSGQRSGKPPARSAQSRIFSMMAKMTNGEDVSDSELELGSRDRDRGCETGRAAGPRNEDHLGLDGTIPARTADRSTCGDTCSQSLRAGSKDVVSGSSWLEDDATP